LSETHGSTWYPDQILPAGDRTQPDVPVRYEVIGLLGSGGMGEVWRVRDTELDRSVAMKVVRAELSERAGTLARFEAEARLCARLQHPAIVPVHDQGVTGDGRLWFTMRELRGETLQQHVDSVHRASAGSSWLPDPEGWTLRRLLSCFEQVCLAVAYAHTEGVIHRDLKPDNVMVGAFGEVQVMDWGVATVVEHGEAPRRGSVGTPAYMAPEQASGRAHQQGPATDIYALGATLYCLLAGRKPYTASSPTDVIVAVMTSTPRPLTSVHDKPIAPELVELVEHAMARKPEDRPPDAHQLARRIREHLDGLRRRDAARDRVDSVRALADLARELRRRSAALRLDAAERLAPLAAHAPVDEKRTAWALEDRADALALEAEEHEAHYVQGLQEALILDDLPEAHRLLAAHYRIAVSEAEHRGDGRAVTAAELGLAAHDRGEHAAFLAGVVRVRVPTEPPEARWLVDRLTEEDRALVPRPEAVEQSDGALLLPRGSWLLRSRCAGRAEVVVPVRARRGEPHRNTRPDGQPVVVRLPEPDELPTGTCYVPPGWFWAGGDEEAYDALEGQWVYVEGLVVSTFPVTRGDYLAFLGALRVSRGDEAACAHVPGNADEPDMVPDPGSGFVLANRGRLDLPVTAVTWHDAMAYAAWLAEATGRPWRLLHDLEWEKAARGTDGRRFPWGHRWDATFARTRTSAEGAPEAAPVTSYPTDTSVYGVRGLGGNVREWCLNDFQKEGPANHQVRPEPGSGVYRMVRGSCYADTRPLPVATRLVGDPTGAYRLFGFRLGFRWP